MTAQVRNLISTRGVKALWAGAVPRAARLAIGTTVLDRCITYFGDFFLESSENAKQQQQQQIQHVVRASVPGA